MTTPAQGERRALLAMVLEDVARLERLLSGVREISRIDAGDAGEDVERVEMKALAGRVVEGYRMRAPAPAASLAWEVTGGEAHVSASPGRLAQALENLVDNAASFSPPRGRVEVEVSREGTSACIRVRDQGPGIPPGNMQRIFDRFFSDRPGSSAGSHAGLGLAIARSIIENAGGSVSAENLPRGGACFLVRLPLA
jgi:two-component system sensor histidine kinase ChvG